MRGRFVAMLLVASVAVVAAAAPLNLLTNHVDNARTGANLAETLLTTHNVKGARFGKLFTRAVVGSMYAQPLYLSAVGGHNVVYLATMHNLVYCFDADDPAAASPIWSVQLEPSSPLPDPNIGANCGVYRDIAGEIGIVSTPVIDLSRQLIYVVTTSRDMGGAYSHHLHALSILDGSEPTPPVTIGATVPGTGTGSVGGNITFESQFQNQRASLLLSGGQIYIGFSSYCDSGPYHGWLFRHDAGTLAQTAVINFTPDGGEGSIWGSGEGPSADGSGDIYVANGNGTVNYQTGGLSISQSFMRFNSALTLLDYFIPYNFQFLNSLDFDIGSTGLLLVPGTTLMVGGGKQGWLYVVDRTNLGHFHDGDDSQIVQTFSVTNGGGVYGSPVYWNGLLYVWGQSSDLKAFHYNGVKFDQTPVAQYLLPTRPPMPGGILSLSADGTTASSGVLWSNLPVDSNANQMVVAGVLRAFDAADVSVQLWNSEDNPARDRVGNFAKFNPPTIANGKVYQATFSDQLAVYGLLPMGVALSVSPSPAPFAQAVTLTAQVTGPVSGSPTGQVGFFDAATPLGTASLDADGQAQAAFSLAVGSHPITVGYPGDGRFSAAISPIVNAVVLQAASATTLFSSMSPSPLGAALTLTAQVTSTGTPTGSVAFSDGATPLGSSNLDGSGRATLMLSTLSGGVHTLHAVYSGDAQRAGSSGLASQQIVAAPTLLTATAEVDPERFGVAVRFRFVATSTCGSPTGMISLRDGMIPLGQTTLDGSGHAQLDTGVGGAGLHLLTAEYGGDDNCQPATAPLMQTVDKADSTVQLTVAGSTLIAHLAGNGGGIPSGEVRFLDGTMTLGQATIDLLGGASLRSSPLAAGDHTLWADYAGDANFNAAQSAPQTATVAADAGPTDLAANPPDLGQIPSLPGPGCACQLSGDPGVGSGLWAALLLALWALARRRPLFARRVTHVTASAAAAEYK